LRPRFREGGLAPHTYSLTLNRPPIESLQLCSLLLWVLVLWKPFGLLHFLWYSSPLTGWSSGYSTGIAPPPPRDARGLGALVYSLSELFAWRMPGLSSGLWSWVPHRQSSAAECLHHIDAICADSPSCSFQPSTPGGMTFWRQWKHRSSVVSGMGDLAPD
jgi:hypothetical protein